MFKEMVKFTPDKALRSSFVSLKKCANTGYVTPRTGLQLFDAYVQDTVHISHRLFGWWSIFHCLCVAYGGVWNMDLCGVWTISCMMCRLHFSNESAISNIADITRTSHECVASTLPVFYLFLYP